MGGENPIKHHYIPQFLLRPFCFDGARLHYYNKQTNLVTDRRIEETFMVRNLYRDDINHPGSPVQMEKDFSKFEDEVAKIIKRFREDDEVILTLDEDSKLKLFFAVMGFRAERVSKMFGPDANEEFKEFYSLFQKDGNLEDLWKRNLGEIVNCRSLQEVLQNPNIDEPIKLFMRRDTEGLFGSYFVIAEKRGPEEFIIGDSYPPVVTGSSEMIPLLTMYSICPISPTRVLLLAANGVEGAQASVSGFEKSFFRKPNYNSNEKTIRHHLRKVYENQVKMLNSITYDAAECGIIFKSRENASIDEFESIYASWNNRGEIR